MFMPQNTDHLSLEQKIQLLLDERAIRNVLYRWCRAIDRLDVELLRTCFFEDAKDHHAPLFDCTGEELFGMVENLAPTLSKSMTYMVGNLLIEIDGDTARSEAVLWAHTILNETTEQGGPLVSTAAFRYLDRFERRNGEWRIAERWYVPGLETIQATATYPLRKNRVFPPAPRRCHRQSKQSATVPISLIISDRLRSRLNTPS